MIKAYFDGACSVNPGGKIGWGFYILNRNEQRIYWNAGHILTNPNNTNNLAEYTALDKLINCLMEHPELKSSHITIHGDSMLVVQQMNGKWMINKGAYKQTAINCLVKIWQFKHLTFTWIPREQNIEADRLSKLHLNERQGFD